MTVILRLPRSGPRGVRPGRRGRSSPRKRGPSSFTAMAMHSIWISRLRGNERKMRNLRVLKERGLDFLEDVDLERAGKHRSPRLQIGLHPDIAGDSLPVELPVAVRF